MKHPIIDDVVLPFAAADARADELPTVELDDAQEEALAAAYAEQAIYTLAGSVEDADGQLLAAAMTTYRKSAYAQRKAGL